MTFIYLYANIIIIILKHIYKIFAFNYAALRMGHKLV